MSGSIVDCVKYTTDGDAIPGTGSTGIPCDQYRGWFKGSLQLPGDPQGKVYSYAMPVWIIMPKTPADRNGTVIVEPLHTQGLVKGPPPTTWTSSAAEAEQSLALKCLGPRFLFGKSKAYTWIGLRWDPLALIPANAQARFDHAFAQRDPAASPGTILSDDGTPSPQDRASHVGHAMLADLAEAVRSGQFLLKPPAPPVTFTVARLIAFGQSQTGRILAKLLAKMPARPAGAPTPLFDGWMVCGARRRYEAWPWDPIPVDNLEPIRPDPSSSALGGRIMDVSSENDIGVSLMVNDGNECMRFRSEKHRFYEIAGAPHFAFGAVPVRGRFSKWWDVAHMQPEGPDRLAEQAKLNGLDLATASLPVKDALECDTGRLCTNPLNWNPVVRALMVALEEWIDHPENPTPENRPLQAPVAEGDPDQGIATIVRNSIGNAAGGVRLPDVHIGRGRFMAPYVGGVRGVELTDRGEGYANPPAVKFSFTQKIATGAAVVRAATATARVSPITSVNGVLSGGEITEIVIDDPGEGYYGNPAVQITPQAGDAVTRAAKASAVVLPGDTPFAGGYRDLNSRFFAYRSTGRSRRILRDYVTEFTAQADRLVSQRYLLPDDRDALVLSATESFETHWPQPHKAGPLEYIWIVLRKIWGVFQDTGSPALHGR
jgi:hypothetical protein